MLLMRAKKVDRKCIVKIVYRTTSTLRNYFLPKETSEVAAERASQQTASSHWPAGDSKSLNHETHVDGTRIRLVMGPTIFSWLRFLAKLKSRWFPVRFDWRIDLIRDVSQWYRQLGHAKKSTERKNGPTCADRVIVSSRSREWLPSLPRQRLV